MAFTLLVCSDVSGHKLNLEIPFNEKPQLPNLHASIEGAFEYEAQRGGRRGGSPPGSRGPIPPAAPYSDSFALGRVQIYSDEIRQWVDLVSSSQLHPYDQLYAYQRNGGNGADDVTHSSGRELPPPVSSGYFSSSSSAPQQQIAQSSPSSSSMYRTGPNGSATYGRSTAVVDAADLGETVRTYRTTSPVPGANSSTNRGPGSEIQVISAPAEAFHMSTEEKMRLVFQNADVEGNGYLALADFREIFTRTHIQFNRATVDEIFRFQGSNPNYLNYNEFTNFCRQYPVTFGALFTRVTDRKRASKLEAEMDEAAEHMNGLRRRREQLQLELEQVSGQLLQSETHNRKIAGELSEQLKHRETVEEEEQLVLDKEVRVAYQREILRREEADFVATAKRFDMHVDHLGQPGSGNLGSNPSPYRH